MNKFKQGAAVTAFTLILSGCSSWFGERVCPEESRVPLEYADYIFTFPEHAYMHPISLDVTSANHEIESVAANVIQSQLSEYLPSSIELHYLKSPTDKAPADQYEIRLNNLSAELSVTYREEKQWESDEGTIVVNPAYCHYEVDMEGHMAISFDGDVLFNENVSGDESYSIDLEDTQTSCPQTTEHLDSMIRKASIELLEYSDILEKTKPGMYVSEMRQCSSGTMVKLNRGKNSSLKINDEIIFEGHLRTPEGEYERFPIGSGYIYADDAVGEDYSWVHIDTELATRMSIGVTAYYDDYDPCAFSNLFDRGGTPPIVCPF